MAIFGGGGTMAVLLDDGVLYGWGENLSGQIVSNTWWAKTRTPERIIDIPCATKASVGTVGIAIHPDGRAFTWGRESYDQRGDGPGTDEGVFSWLDLERVTDVSSRRGAVAAATGREAYWWGDILGYADVPTALGVEANFVSANVAASCLVSVAGEVMCWGNNDCGGDPCSIFPNDVSSAPEPIPIAVSGPAVSVAIDVLTTCALLESGDIECWGLNSGSALGRGVDYDELDEDPNPAAIVEPGPFVGLVTSDQTFCAWRESGEVYCWGSNGVAFRAPFDDIPDGLPTRVPELEPAKQVAVTTEELCALGFDGLVRCRIAEPDPAKPQLARVLSFAGPEDEGGQ